MLNDGRVIEVGGCYNSFRHGLFYLVSYENANKVLIRFENTGWEKWVTAFEVKRGFIKDSSGKSSVELNNTGIRDVNLNSDNVKTYKLWSNMLRRCYHPNELKRNPTYVDCIVSEDFLRFSNFLKFVKSMKEYGLRDDNGRSYCLDKDILSTDKKIYDENTVCLIPQEINKFFQNRQADRGKFSAGVYYDKDRSKFCARVTYQGKTKFLGRFCTEEDAWFAYKEYKKQVAIELAEKWYGRVDKRVYETLINYNADDWV